MKTYQVIRKQFLPIDLETSWAFFSSPGNLSVITPPRMRFKIMAQSGGDKMREGQMIVYRVTVLPLVRLTWVTEIVRMEEPLTFTDEQRKGPYSLWRHRHQFQKVPDGIEMTDTIEYAIPFGWLGQLANYLFVAREVNRIFDYRFRILETRFKNT